MTIFSTLANFNPWVNAHIYDAVATLADEEYRRDEGLFFGSIHRTLNHILVVDRLWFCRVQGVKPDVKSLDQILFNDFDQLRAGRQAEDQQIIDIVSGFDLDALSEEVSFITTDGRQGQLPRAHMLMAVFNHQTHHRGQVTALLSKFGADYDDIDLPYYLASV